MVHRLLIIVTSLLAENTHQGARALVAVAPRIWSAVSAVVVHGLSCLMVCGIFMDQGSRHGFPGYLTQGPTKVKIQVLSGSAVNSRFTRGGSAYNVTHMAVGRSLCCLLV